MQTFVTIAALAATASAYQLSIHNNCQEDAYIWSCGDDLGDMQTLKAGKVWNEKFYSKEGGSAGPSIYISNGTSNTDGNIAQMEYFYQEATEKVWWDISLINGNPYPTIGLGSDLETTPYAACKPVICVEDNCDGTVYKTHEQLEGTHDCPPSNLVLKLCDADQDWNAGRSSASDGSSSDDSDSSDNSNNSGSSYSAAPQASSSAAASPVASSSSASQAAYTLAPVPEVSSSQQAPKATKTAAEVELGQDNNGNVVMHTAYATTVVTAIVTQTAQPKGSGEALNTDGEGYVHGKREAHGHAHAHNSRSRVRRHQHSA